jgi:hypothetical protein
MESRYSISQELKRQLNEMGYSHRAVKEIAKWLPIEYGVREFFLHALLFANLN